MSVKFHEAFCLDSARRQFNFEDHFLGDSLRDLWTNTLGSGGTGAVVDGVDGGVFRLGTPTASDSSTLWWNNVRTIHVNKKVTIEARVRANGGVTDTTRRMLSIRFDASNYIRFWHNTDSSDIIMVCIDNGTPTSQDSGINLDDQFHIYRIECFPAGEVHFYIDGAECANSPITTNIPDDAADYLQPYFYIESNADTYPATSMDIDYVWCRQDR